MSLKKFVEQENMMNRIFNQPMIDLSNLNQESADKLFQRLDSNLSPENLSADGELPRAKVQQRYKLYMGAINDLKKLGFTPTEEMYSI